MSLRPTSSSLFPPPSLPIVSGDAEFARRLVQEEAPLPDGLLTPVVQRSWERVRAAGIRPDDQALFQHYVSVHDMRRVQEHHSALIDLALPDMEQLRSSMRSTDWVVLLTDPLGMIVHSLGAHEHAPRELRLPLRAGRRLYETELGTNAPALVASEPAAVAVRGEEHFLTELRRLSCAAAPIFSPDGRVAGVLDITGFDVAWNSRILERVQLACRSIEERLFECASEGWILRLHEDPRFIGTPAQGLLWVGESGLVRGANAAAQAMLSLNERALSTHALHIESLLDGPVGLLPSTASADRSDALDPRPVFTHQGNRLFALASHCRPAQPHNTARRHAAPLSEKTQAHTDPQWQTAFLRASKVFPSGLPVLLQGETGTGKEWFARALHEVHRPNKPFVAINCAALVEGTAEAELFGYVEGAFTGSKRGGAAGRIEQAQGGTLFLDEIGDMPAHLQTRLLRVLQERSLTRVGSGNEIALDILVVAASHRDLAHMVQRGAFREDLYFRLNGLKVRLPTLRERSDLDALIDFQLAQNTSKHGVVPQLSPALRQHLKDYQWPGNIRQLQHALHVASLLADAGQIIDARLLPEEIQTAIHAKLQPAPRQTSQAAPADLELTDRKKQWMQQVLQDHAGNHSAAARALGISRTTLYKYLVS